MKLSWILSPFILFAAGRVDSVLADDGDDTYGGGGLRGLNQLFDDIDNTTTTMTTTTLVPTTVSPTVSPTAAPTETPGEWETITHDPFDSEDDCTFDFEEKCIKYDLGPHTYIDCDGPKLASNNEYIFKGRHSLRLRGESFVQHKQNYDVSDYVNLRLRCWITARSWTGLKEKNEGEEYLVKYSSDGGSSWTTMAQSSDLTNGIFTYLVVDFDETGKEYNLNKRARIRLEQKGGQNDVLYFDECWFEGYRTDVSTQWNVITYDTFKDEYGENTWGSFTEVDKGDADIYKGELMIRKDNGKDSSAYQEDGYDVTECSYLRCSFTFYSLYLEKGEGFVLQYLSGSDGWTTVKHYIRGHEDDDDDHFYFKNRGWIFNSPSFKYKPKNRIYHETVIWSADDYNFNTTNGKIRFRSKSDGDNEETYIDNVLFECGKPME